MTRDELTARHALYYDTCYVTSTLFSQLPPKTKKCFGATRMSFLGHTGFFWLFLAFFGRDEVFFVRDARRACRGATCRTACWDFRVPSHAMVGVVVGV